MNLNDIITDEEDTEYKGMSSVESDDLLNDFNELDSLFTKDKVDELIASNESYLEMKDLYRYIKENKTITKKLAQEVDTIFGDLFKPRMSKESYTDIPTLTNYADTIIFMDSKINNSENNRVAVLQEIMDKGIDDCQGFYEKFRKTVIPTVMETYSEIYTFITENSYIKDLDSVIFLDQDNNFVNVYNLPIDTVVNMSLKDIPDYPGVYENVNKSLKDLVELLNDNKLFAKFIKTIVDNNTPVALSEITKVQLSYYGVTTKDLMSLFRDNKGFWYFNNIHTLIDYAINIIDLKRADYKETTVTGVLSQYAVDINEELVEIKRALSFVLEFVKCILPFLYICKSLFISLEVV